MKANEYQEQAEATNLVTGENALTYAALGLVGEAGEIANKAKKIIRDDNNIVTDEKRAAIKKEIGDVLWYVSRICSELGFTLEEVMEQNLAKLSKRQAEGKLQGDGDNR